MRRKAYEIEVSTTIENEIVISQGNPNDDHLVVVSKDQAAQLCTWISEAIEAIQERSASDDAVAAEAI